MRRKIGMAVGLFALTYALMPWITGPLWEHGGYEIQWALELKRSALFAVAGIIALAVSR